MEYDDRLYNLLCDLCEDESNPCWLDDHLGWESEIKQLNKKGHRANLVGTEFHKKKFREMTFENADLHGAVFDEVDLWQTDFVNADLTDVTFSGELLERVNFSGAILKNADFSGVKRMKSINFSGAKLFGVKLPSFSAYDFKWEGANLTRFIFKQVNFPPPNDDEVIDFTECDLSDAEFPALYAWNARFQKARLKGTKFSGGRFQNTDFSGADLFDTDFTGCQCINANLSGADLYETKLRGANFQYAVVDGFTKIRAIDFDEETDFRGAALQSAQIQPGYRDALNGIVRKKIWENWYRMDGTHSCITKGLVRIFWWFSDYGRSTRRLLWSFGGLALFFALFYWVCSMLNYPAIQNLQYVDLPNYCHHIASSQNCAYGTSYEPLSCGMILFRSFYFSIVTMTTLGFGDMSAYPFTWHGYILVMLQVVLGYVLLGALVTRLGILFTGDGPIVLSIPKKQSRKK